MKAVATFCVVLVAVQASEYCTSDDPSCVDAATPITLQKPASHAITDPAEVEDNYEFKERSEQYNTQGVAFAKEGKLEPALKHFRAATYHQAHRQDVWANIGLVTRDIANALPIHDTLKKMALYREALQAFELAVWLGDQQSISLLARLQSTFKSTFPRKCLAQDCQRYQAERRAFAALDKGEVYQAAHALCKTVDAMTITLSLEERKGPLTTATFHRFYTTMKVCGVAVIKDVYRRELLRNIHTATAAHWQEWDVKLRKIEKEASSEHKEFRDAASRSDNRYEVKFPLQRPYTDPDFVSNRIQLSLMKVVIGGRYEIDTFSYVASRAGAADQHWHADVSQLFSRWMNAPSRQLPSNGIVNIVPLVDMTMETGPTEFMTASHWPHSKSWKDFNENSSPTPVHRLAANLGSSVLFDVQIYHRGTANRSGKMRPIVYMSYVREWWFDRVNFKDSQTKDFDELSTTQKKLFLRLDSRDYVKRLEHELEKRGVTVATLQSTSDYKKNDLEL